MQIEVQGASRPTRAEAEAAVRLILAYIGEDPSREGLVDTPKRVVASFDDFYAGYWHDPRVDLARIFSDICGYDGIVLLRGIPFVTHDEGDMRPVIGTAHIAYYPTEDGVLGISKFVRVVETYARRLQTLDRLADDIITAIGTNLRTRGCALALSLCSLDAAKARNLRTRTRFIGCFDNDDLEQSRFLALVAPREGQLQPFGEKA